MPLYASIFISIMWGALTAVILWGGTLLLLVGELGGPINLAVPTDHAVAVPLVGFINGLPLVVIELKQPGVREMTNGNFRLSN